MARSRLVPNPPWVSALLAKSMVTLQSKVPPPWMPKFEATHKARGSKIDVELAEYGTGAYGTVMPTLDPGVVMKLTSDPSEAKFATEIADTLPTPCVTHYHLAVKLEGGERHGRPVYLLWRESAENVGEVDKIAGQRAEDAINKQHQAAQAAYIAADDGDTDAYGELVQKWRDACLKMSRVPELEYVAIGMIRAWDEQGIFISDVHGGNLGQCTRNGRLQWVITDPGNVVLSRDPAEDRSTRQRARNPADARILHVEDEPAIAAGVARALAKHATVVSVDTVDEAITRLRAGESFDLIISDYDLRDGTADALVAWIDKHAPAMKARMFFLSGNAAAESFGVPVLAKPARTPELRAMVARFLDAPPTPNPRRNPDVDPMATARIVKALVFHGGRHNHSTVATKMAQLRASVLHDGTDLLVFEEALRYLVRMDVVAIIGSKASFTEGHQPVALTDKALAYVDRGTGKWPDTWGVAVDHATDVATVWRLFRTVELWDYVRTFLPHDGAGWTVVEDPEWAPENVLAGRVLVLGVRLFHETNPQLSTIAQVRFRRDFAFPSITVSQWLVEDATVPWKGSEVDKAVDERTFPRSPQEFLAMLLPFLTTYAP